MKIALNTLLAFCMTASAGLADPAATQAINLLRAGSGLAPLRFDAQLETAAKAHAADMISNGFFDHQGSDGSNVGARISRAGYRWCLAAENIAKGQDGLDEVMQAWANSPGHLENMLRPGIEDFAVVRGPDKTWVMVLAAGC